MQKICYNQGMNNYEDFLSTVSHELRTPLTSIRGFSQTMLNSWDKLDDESKKKFLKIIEDQSNRLIALVENMLSVTKLQSEKDNFVYKEINLKTVIEPVITIIKNNYPNHKFEFVFNDKSPNIVADRDKFQQVMTNLIENAAKYSEDNSTVTVKVFPSENTVVIAVTDRGIGILPENYNRIFEKFSRIDCPLTRKVQGSGLGLYITKNLVEKMGGNIAVISGDGETTFKVVMPVKSVEEQARAKCSQ